MKYSKYILFNLYIFLLVYVVFLSRRRHNFVWHDDLINLFPIKNTINSFYYIPEIGLINIIINIFGNIILFIPMPFFLQSIFGLCSYKQALVVGCIISVLIEFTQYLLRIGVPDVDDIILNVLGVAIGISVRRYFSFVLKILP